ncbi:uncharacterized protein LOC141600235 [Silene latifolia]|uniref:uncharacterized protein LOC141600235 n=1 Tax=Silene latifolia TaxID=37657 RepID=UPI003D778A68
MKRELAALETASLSASPVSESIRRKTRFGNSDDVSQRLVYKRVKRSPSTAVVAVSTVMPDAEAEAKEGEEKVGSLNEKESEGVDMVEVCVEVEKGMCDEVVGGVVEVSTMEVDDKGETGERKVKEDDVEEDWLSKMKTPVKVGNGKRKKFGIARYQRRFTRSALKCNVVEENGVEKKTIGDDNVEGCRVETVLQNGGSENNNGDLKDCLVEDGRRRVTRSSVGKPKEDGPDSCLTETSDSMVAENAEMGISNEGGECGVEKQDEETETMSATRTRKLEMEMSKQIVVERCPKTVRELFETGLLEGCPVYYDGGKGPKLRGRIRAIGICCPCNTCRGRSVIPPSLFEIHANNTYKRAVQYIYLENGRSLIQILKACKNSRLRTPEETVQNAIGPLPERKVAFCQNCEEPYLTVDAECSDPVCCSCVMSNLSPTGPAYSSRKLRWSSKFGTPRGGSSPGKLRDCSPENSDIKNSIQGKSAKTQEDTFLTPKMRSSLKTGKTLETKTSEKSANNPEVLMPKAFSSPVTVKSLATKTAKKLMKKSAKPSKLTRVGKSSKKDGRVKTTKRLRKETLTPKPSKTTSVNRTSEKTPGKITRKDLKLHKLVFEDDILPDGTELGYYARGKKLLDGYKKGSGIFCNCCETVISASQFEAHAGCAARRKPYCYIYTSNGVSLHELSINLIKGRSHTAKFNDDLCSICADGGNLLLCDGCPRAFHTECASLSNVPRGKWYCKYCESMFEREKFVEHNANAFAAGRVSGVDPIEQITKRSIRIVNNVGSDVSSCILCRGFDFSKSGFGPRTIILCDQCEKEYHVGCLKDHDMADLTELPDGKWFCSLGCGKIDSALQNLLDKGDEKLPESLVNVITKKNLHNVSESLADVDISWRLLSGKIVSPETRPLLSQAVAIFHESFSPIVEVVSGHDLIPAMVYGRNVGGQEYGGMYCAVLTVKSVVVSAAIFRVFGPEVAELPLVATSSGNHGKGYFQALYACIEGLLTTLKIKTFVLPAAEEAKSIWIDRFGFKKMTPDQLGQLKSNFWSMVRFEGTSMLHKPIPECTPVQSSGD